MSDDKVMFSIEEGRNNIIDFDEFRNLVNSTLDEISDIITPLCGPKALTDLVIGQHIHTGHLSDIFSNDGIHILKSISYDNPLQNFIVNYIKYIAEKVDAAAADGTSTAILFSSEVLREALEVVSTIRSNSEFLDMKPVMDDINDLRIMINDLIKHMAWVVESYRVKLSDVDDNIRKALIYRLAMTTGKNYDTLAKFAVEIFSELPELLYEQINSKEDRVETSEVLRLEYPESDIVVNALGSSATKFNHNLNTEFVSDDTDLLPIATMIDSVSADILLQFLKEYSEKSDRQIVLLLSGIDEAGFARLERNVDRERITICRLTYFRPTFINNPTEAKVILAMAGKPTDEPRSVLDFSKAVIENVKVKLADKSLYVDNLIPKDPNTADSKLHPYYRTPGTHAPYDRLRHELEDRIVTLKTSHNSSDLRYELDEFTRIYRLMVYSKSPILIIGGSTVDHLAMINVVADVLGAVSVAMKHGVVIDAIPKITTIFNGIIGVSTEHLVFINRLREFFERYTLLTYQLNSDETEQMLNTLSVRHTSIDDLDMTKLFFNDGEWLGLDKATVKDVGVVQSYRTFEEMFKRLLDTIPKLITVDKVIIPHSTINRKSRE